MAEDILSGEGLEKALVEGTLLGATTTPGAEPIVGMVKQAASGSISFSLVGCDSWVDIPIVLIERAEQIGHQPCRDHSHPLMRITLKATDDPAAKVLGALLRAMAPSGGATSTMAQLQNSAAALIGPPWGGSNGFIFCFPQCIEWSKLFPNVCNRWVWRCGMGPIIFFPPIYF